MPLISTIELKKPEGSTVTSLLLAPLGKVAEPLPDPVKPESEDIKTVIIREKLAKQNLEAFGIKDFNAIDLKAYGFDQFE